MKTLFLKLTAAFVMVLLLGGCEDRFSAGYTIKLPEPPEAWVSLLGEPCWRLEWLDSDGKMQRKDIPPRKTINIDLPSTWANPVTAWPFWPEHNLIPGFFKPAGALFPFDVSRSNLPLSWKAGHDTVFYWELALANSSNAAKVPANFDWPRFRLLFEAGTINEAVINDPWLVDWRYVAERTISANFDNRRLVPQAAESVNIPVFAGPWYGTSPFAQPLYFFDEETQESLPPVFSVRPGVNVWVSADGILRVSGETWVFTEFP